MFSAIIMDENKSNEKPEYLQGDVVFVVSAKKVEEHYETSTMMAVSQDTEMELATYGNLGVAIREIIDKSSPDNKILREIILKAFEMGFNKKAGNIEVLDVKERSGCLSE